jgi:hypothetical protein
MGPGVARATGHHFRRGLTLRTRCIKGNSHRGSSNGGGDWSRARDGGRLSPTFGNVDNELQQSADDENRLCRGGVTCIRVTWCWLSEVESPTE